MKHLLKIALLGIAVLAGGAGANAQNANPSDVKAALDTFHAALSSLDMTKMSAIWAHTPDVMLINPRDTEITVGWEDIQKNWQKVFGFWKEIKITRVGEPHIHVSGDFAWADAIVGVSGTTNAGNAANIPTMETDVLQKQGGRWLIVSHSAWRVPQ